MFDTKLHRFRKVGWIEALGRIAHGVMADRGAISHPMLKALLRIEHERAQFGEVLAIHPAKDLRDAVTRR